MSVRIRTVLVFLMLYFLTLGGRPGFTQATSQMLVTTNWLAAHLSDTSVVILDVGNDRRSYYAGHIPGAQFLPLNEIARMNPGGWLELPPVADLKTALERAGVGNHSRIILYGDYKGMFAARAYFTLDYLGLGGRAALLDGGLEKWTAEHRPLSNDVVVSHPSTLTVSLHPAVVADLSTVMRDVSNKTVPLIDARAPVEFAGEKGGSGADRKGHIPGAKDVFWIDNLSGADIPALKPVAAIRARYMAVGLKPGEKVIVYCHAGLQASFDYFTLKLAGFRPVLYCGSFSQWVATFGAPVETTGN